MRALTNTGSQYTTLLFSKKSYYEKLLRFLIKYSVVQTDSDVRAKDMHAHRKAILRQRLLEEALRKLKSFISLQLILPELASPLGAPYIEPDENFKNSWDS